jgi:hypothetical protein
MIGQPFRRQRFALCSMRYSFNYVRDACMIDEIKQIANKIKQGGKNVVFTGVGI